MDKFTIVSRIRELNKASEAYYNTGQPIMSDYEFDQKLCELQEWENETGIIMSNSPTHNVGCTVITEISKVVHKTPMLSLDKCHSTEEIIKFANNHNLVGSIKLDGVSCRLIYKDGNLIRAESRGNGTEGSDITEAVRQFQNVPLHIDKNGEYIIDGEALIKLDDFSEINKNDEFKNSRNLTAGTLASLDTSIVKDRKLSWYAWEVVDGYKDTNSFYLNLLEANTLGFDVVPFVDVQVNYFDNLQKYIDKFIETAEEMHLPQDGVVFKFDDVSYGKSLGNTSHHFNNGIAFKIFNESVETTLRNVEWSMGKTGSLCPVAVFDPVEIDGSIVERASLHNVSVMNELLGRSWEGQKVGVYKANLIIPAIRWAEQFDSSKFDDIILDVSYINIPNKCPICGSPTEIRKDNDSEVLYCTNGNCKGRLLGKLTHAVSRNAFNIDGLSESTIEKFIDLGWLNSIKDIYHLSDHKNEMKALEGFGKKSVEKLLSSVEKSRKTTLSRFLYSLSIPLLGKSASADIAKACEDGNYDAGNFMKIMTTIGAEYFRNIPGIGDSLINSLDSYFNKHCSEIWQLAKEFDFEQNTKIQTNTKLAGKTFCITGSLNHYKNRDELVKQIEALGGNVSSSVSSKTDFLINNDIESNSSKNKKAKSLGIPILDELHFIAMIS